MPSAAAPLTRHLYRVDEVEAALMLSCIRGRLREAAFWCLELLDSGLTTQLVRALRTIWFLGFGAKALGWWRSFETAAAAEALDSEEFVRLAVGLARSGRDATAVALLGVPETAVPDAVSFKGWDAVATASATAATTPLEQFLLAAGLQGRVVATWQAARTVGSEAIALLRRGLVLKHGEIGAAVAETLELHGDVLPPGQILAIWVLSFCASTADLKRGWAGGSATPLPSEVEEDVVTWSCLTGRRARRAVAIPIDCLYWLTARGRAPMTVYDSTEKDLLRWRFARPQQLWGSEWWDEAAEAVGGWMAIAERDEALEAFWQQQFPDDWPDEWSRADRAKSHGGGVLQRGGAATAGEWIRRWFRGIPCGVWMGVAGAAAGATAAGSLEELLEELSVGSVSTEGWTLRPMRRIVGTAAAAE